MTMGRLVIHYLRHGWSACRMMGVPAEWPANHKWEDDWNLVNCEECLAKIPPEARAARAAVGVERMAIPNPEMTIDKLMSRIVGLRRVANAFIADLRSVHGYSHPDGTDEDLKFVLLIAAGIVAIPDLGGPSDELSDAAKSRLHSLFDLVLQHEIFVRATEAKRAAAQESRGS
jgi:hypothetical protein